MRVRAILAVLLICASASAEFVLTDIDVSQIMTIAGDSVPGDVISMEPADGPSRRGSPDDGDVNAHVRLLIKTAHGTRMLVVSRIGDVWLIADSELKRLERMRKLRERLRRLREQNSQPNQSLQQTPGPVAILAVAKPAPASIAAELRR